MNFSPNHLQDVDCVEFHTWGDFLYEGPSVLLYFFNENNEIDGPPQIRPTSAKVVCMSWVMVASHFNRFHWFHKGFVIYFQEKTIKINVLHNCCAKTNLHVCKLDLVMSWSITCINWPQQITWFACCQNIETCVKGNHVKVFVTTKGGGLSRELPHTRKLHRELPREQANHMISCELVDAIELWPNEPCTPQLMVEAIVKDHGISDQTSPQNKQQGYNPEEESHKPRGLIHENRACKHIGIHENQDFECKTCMFSMKSLENLANAVKSMVFQWKSWKNKHFQCFL